MIVNVSPTASSADHTLNTLRYADRVKERKTGPPESGGGGNVQQVQPLKPEIVKRMAPPANSKSPPQPPVSNNEKKGWGNIPSSYENQRQPQSRLGYIKDEEDEEEEDEMNVNESRDDDLHQLHMSLRKVGLSNGSGDHKTDNICETVDENDNDEESAKALEDLHRTVEGLFEEEEALLNLHMNVIQENAELLTEEGRLLQQIQGEDVVDYDIGRFYISYYIHI
jgi:kinesin family protein 2/24